MNCRLQQSKRNYKVTPPWSNRSPQNFHVSQILNDVATTRDSGSRKGIWNFNQDSWHCKLLLLRPWDPNKDIHVGNPCSCCLHWKLFLTHTNNSPGRRAVTREWRHGQEPPQTNLTGQNNLLRRRAQWKQWSDSSSWTLTESDMQTPESKVHTWVTCTQNTKEVQAQQTLSSDSTVPNSQRQFCLYSQFFSSRELQSIHSLPTHPTLGGGTLQASAVGPQHWLWEPLV